MVEYVVTAAGPFFDEPIRAQKTRVSNVERNAMVATAQQPHLSKTILDVLSMVVLDGNVSFAGTNVVLK